MQRFREIANATQTKNIQEQNLICRLIIEQIENKYGVRFPKYLQNNEKVSYLNLITTLLLIPEYSKYKNDVIYLLKQCNVDERGLLLHLLGVTNQIKYGYTEQQAVEVRNQIINSLSKLPYCEIVSLNRNMLNIDTKYGKIKVYKYDDFVEDKQIKQLMKEVIFCNKCHSVVQFMGKYYMEDYIVTSEIPILFGGSMYHSYFKNNDGIIDISGNMFYEGDCFNSVFKPEEILNIKSKDFLKEYRNFLLEEKIIDDGMAPVLALALNNKLKSKK